MKNKDSVGTAAIMTIMSYEGQHDRVNVAATINRVGQYDRANVAPAMNRFGHQDSASDVSRSQAKITTRAPGQRKRPRHSSHSPCPYVMGTWHRIGGGTPVRVSGGEG